MMVVELHGSVDVFNVTELCTSVTVQKKSGEKCKVSCFSANIQT